MSGPLIRFPVQINLSFLFNIYFHSHMSTEKHEILVVRRNGKNYSTWAFHFEIFVLGKDLWGHVDGSTPVPDKEKDKVAHAKWVVKDAQVMSWVLGSVDPNIVLNLRPYKTAATMWNYLKKVYNQNNAARRFQLEHDIALFKHDPTTSIQHRFSKMLLLLQQ